MNIHLKSFGAKLRSAVFTVVTLSVWFVGSAGSAAAMGINGLIGVMPGFPQIDGLSVVGQDASFVSVGGGRGILTVTGTPNLYFSDAGSLAFINDGLLQLVAVLDSDGTSPASIEITWGSAGILPTPLLVADIVGFGLENSSLDPVGTDRADFLLNPLGGSMLFDPNWNAGSLAGMTMTFENSTYDGSLDQDWQADRVKFVIGQVATGLSEPTTLPLAVMGLAGLWLMRRRTARLGRR